MSRKDEEDSYIPSDPSAGSTESSSGAGAPGARPVRGRVTPEVIASVYAGALKALERRD